MAFLASEDMEHGGELFGEQEEAAIGDRLLIPQCMEDGARCGAGAGDAARRPRAGLPQRRGWQTWRQLVPLRALLDSPTRTTKRFRP